MLSAVEHSIEAPNVQSVSRLKDIAVRLTDNRTLSEHLAAPLTDEDQTVQCMPDASPTKWHLAHTTWFYEAFVLCEHMPDYKPFDPELEYCFNSYYEQKGDRHPRAKRGLLTRPSAARVREYRRYVNEALKRFFTLLAEMDASKAAELLALIELGINHEQQHQELLLTDILALFACNPLAPAYQDLSHGNGAPIPLQDTKWFTFEGGIHQVGASGETFHYDNEGPRHDVLIHPFKLADRLVNNGEWLEFIEDGGYRRPTLWLSDGWAEVQEQNWSSPEYWRQTSNGWQQMTLHGLIDIDRSAPVAHVSYYEADAFARWAGTRLATEFEWEHAAQKHNLDAASDKQRLSALTPSAIDLSNKTSGKLRQLFGHVWQWTASAYAPYPKYRPAEGAIGEYNGKFMANQFVLRGSSALTVAGHSRVSYRNFFYPHQRWQMSGVRLAKDL